MAAGGSGSTIAWTIGFERFELARDGQAELSCFPLAQPLEEVPPAQRDIAIVSANLRLGSGCYCVTFGIDAQVHGRFAAAFAYRFELDQRVRQRQQGGRSGEEIALEIGSEPIT